MIAKNSSGIGSDIVCAHQGPNFEKAVKALARGEFQAPIAGEESAELAVGRENALDPKAARLGLAAEVCEK